ncbi:MAG: hypothetical protein QOG35_2707 [Solirubrobacteraceae bacterium]|nr:hypothetical protein [Solirubrobacteraceae bacterium]
MVSGALAVSRRPRRVRRDCTQGAGAGSKSPYALRTLAELGRSGEGPVPIGELARRRNIPVLEAAGDRHAFAVRVRGRGRPQELVLVGPTPGDARIVMPGEADLSGVLPLPIPVDHERVAAGVRASLSGHWSIRGVEVVDVRLEGTWPLTEVAVLLREDLRPEWLYAWTVPVWKADGRVATEDHELAWVHLMERVEASGYGLPNDPVADERGIVWL